MTRRRIMAVAAAGLALPRAAAAQEAPGGAMLRLAQAGTAADPSRRWAGTLARAGAMDQLRALVIVRDGEVELAEALRGPAPDRPVNVKSVSKTIVAAIMGAAIDRGAVAGADDRLGRIMPDLIPAGADPRVAELTLDDLVTMRAGLDRTSGANYGAWVSSRDWLAYALSRPFVAEPGGRMLYSTGSFHILGAALTHATGESLLSLARNWLGAPLGIDIPAWTRDPQGFYLGGNEMSLSPLAMARFGEMYRQGGRWNGQQVLSPAWIAASARPRTRSAFSGLDYGYGWFLGRTRGGQSMALARGYGGQVIAVVPEARLTVAITSDPTRPARSEGYFGDLLRFLSDELVPAAV